VNALTFPIAADAVPLIHGFTPEQWAAMSRKERARASQKAWRAKRTPEQIEREKETQRKYVARCMATAAGREARNAARLKHYHRMKVDPVWLEKRNARRRIGPVSATRASESLARALSQNELFAAANAAAPKRLPRWVRDDVIADMVIAVLEGQLTVNELAAKAEGFVTRHYRLHETYDTVSLDYRATADDRSIAERITADDLPWNR
jgi:hypothetical protein